MSQHLNIKKIQLPLKEGSCVKVETVLITILEAYSAQY